ncbi:MAG: hypothetical protein ACI8QC_004001, partial [Planctomycetota bacterium]
MSCPVRSATVFRKGGKREKDCFRAECYPNRGGPQVKAGALRLPEHGQVPEVPVGGTSRLRLGPTTRRVLADLDGMVQPTGGWRGPLYVWTRRQWMGACAGGAAAALGLGHLGLRSLSRGRGAVALWLVDAGLGRGPEGGALVGLDRDGFVVRLLRLPRPRAVAVRAGRLWVSVALQGSRAGALGLLELSPTGELLGQRHVQPGARFALDGEGLPWVLSPGPGVQELLDPEGQLVLSGEALLGPVSLGAGVALASGAGELFRASGSGVEQLHVDAHIQALAVAEDGPRWLGRDADGVHRLGSWGQATGRLPAWLGRYVEATHRPCLAAGQGAEL